MLHTSRGATLGPLASDLASASLALARRFARGATLWCWAPDAAEHAQHVAVEFVHPVIMGKRALPAVAVHPSEQDALASLRSLVRSGDVIIVIGPATSDDGLARVLRRVPSWGASTIWIGAGERPGDGAADHVLWLDGDADLAGHDGRLVLVYHLLWELTHVCFEHVGLLEDDTTCEGPVCVTCSDEGTLAEVVRASANTATVRMAGGVEEIDTTLVGVVGSGDLVLVHAGAALMVVDAS